MRIGIDAHFVGMRYGGNEQYFANLIRHLSRRAEDGDEYFVFTHRLAAADCLPGVNAQFIPLAGRSVYWQRAVEIPYHCRRLDLDVLHVPFNFLPVFRAKKIVTIHDLAFLDLSQAYAPLERARMTLLTRFAARWADHVFTLSEFSKRCVMERYEVEETRISVTPCGVDRSVFRPYSKVQREAFRSRMNLGWQYLLFVGMLQERKNVLTLLKAFDIVRSRRKGVLHLVLLGRTGWRAEAVFAFIRERGLGDLVHHYAGVDSDSLAGFYNAAAVFVFPSLFEGFGIPLLEAMSCGCPVISSNVTSMPEVYGDAAVGFNPRDGEELAHRIETVLDDQALREGLVRRGFENCARFSWERTASIAQAAYHSV